MNGLRWLAVPVLALIVLLPASAKAQAISGVVTDSSGAVLPGVTVETSSPALIEKTRSTVTDGAGRYNLVNLSSGTYSVTFTLNGFTTVKREGIQLQQNFTAPVNAKMAVGNLQEVVQVVAEAPLVDVQNLSKPQTMTSEMLSTLPLGTRNLADIANTMIGVTTGGFGSGGYSYRGSTDMVVTIDGNRASYLNLFLGAAPPSGLSPEAYQEYTFTTGIDNVESSAGGLRINVVPKDGGNRFSGSVFGLYTGDGWRSNNISEKFAGPPYNFTKPAALRQQYDFNPSVGGPVIKDKLWYQVTGRVSKTDTYIFNAYNDTDNNPLTYTQGPDAVSSGTNLKSGGVRLTWQASGRDKFTGSYDDQRSRVPNSAGFFFFAGENPLAMGNSFTPHSRNMALKWTRTQTSHLVLEASASNFYTANYFEPNGSVGATWAPRNGGVDPSKSIGHGLDIPTLQDLSIQVAPPSAFLPLRVGDQVGPTAFGNSAISSGDSRTWNANSSATYITGSHTIKAGMTFNRGSQISQERLVGDLGLNFDADAAGVLTSNNVFAYIPQDSVANIDADLGLYIQDQWTLSRLTIKPSLRFDYLKTSIPDQRSPANVWTPLADCATVPQYYCARDGVNWKDLSPRLSLSYDLFGNGKTAVKGGFARYLSDDRLSLTNGLNPTGLGSITRGANLDWNDLNGDHNIINADGTYQLNEIPNYAQQLIEQGFGTTTPTTKIDPALYEGWKSRPFTWEGQVGIDHQLLPRLSATFMYFHRTGGNQYATDFLPTNDSGYDQYCLVAPNDPRLGDKAGDTICGLYDITPAAKALQTSTAWLAAHPGELTSYQTYASNLGNGKGYKNVTDGFEISTRTNLPRGAFLSGGVSIQSSMTDTCSFMENPESARFCHSRGAMNIAPRFSGAYTLPFDIQISGNYQAVRGPSITPSWTAYSTTGNPAGSQINDLQVAAAAGVPFTLPADHLYQGQVKLNNTAGTKTVQLFAANENQYRSYRHQIDLRFSKILNVARYRVSIGLDMYNALNSAAITSVNNTTIGTTKVPTSDTDYLRPGGIIGPRQFKLSATLSF